MSLTEPSTKFFTIEYSRVKVRAAAKGLTMARLARLCGVSRQALGMALKGGNPGLATQERIAAALGLTREQLFAPLRVQEFVAAACWFAGIKVGQR